MENRTWRIIDVLLWTSSYFESKSIEAPRASAELLLSHVLNMERIGLYINHDKPLSENELSEFKNLIKRRAAREPVFYILGYKEFWSLNIDVTKDVLIPRPETELLVEETLKLISEDNNDFNILELGAGSGAISIALAHERAHPIFFASDISIKALRLSMQNALKYSLDKRISFFISDWFAALKKKEMFDIIVSNPPYIKHDDIKNLEPEIRRYEPLRALDGGEDGMVCIKNIVSDAFNYLKKGGKLVLEIGFDQREKIEKLVSKIRDYDNLIFFKDYSNYDRVAMISKK